MHVGGLHRYPRSFGLGPATVSGSPPGYLHCPAVRIHFEGFLESLQPDSGTTGMHNARSDSIGALLMILLIVWVFRVRQKKNIRAVIRHSKKTSRSESNFIYYEAWTCVQLSREHALGQLGNATLSSLQSSRRIRVSLLGVTVGLMERCTQE
jgi:hypothetical protein